MRCEAPRLTISPRVISCHLLRLDDPRTIWVIWCFLAYSTIASAGSSAASSSHWAPRSSDSLRRRVDRLGVPLRHRGIPGHVNDVELGLEASSQTSGTA